MSLKEAAGEYKLVEKTKTSRKIKDDYDPYGTSHFNWSDGEFNDWIMRADGERINVAHRDNFKTWTIGRYNNYYRLNIDGQPYDP